MMTKQRCSKRHVLLCGYTRAASVAAAIPKPPRGCIVLSMKAGEHSQDVNMQAVLHLLGHLRAVNSDLPGLRCILGALDITNNGARIFAVVASYDGFTEGFLKPTCGEELSVHAAAAAEGLSIKILRTSTGNWQCQRVAELTAGAGVCGGHQGVDALEGLGTHPQRAPTSRPGQAEVGCCRISSQVCAHKLAPACSPSATHRNCGGFP